jgi:hypothetical protein
MATRSDVVTIQVLLRDRIAMPWELDSPNAWATVSTAAGALLAGRARTLGGDGTIGRV